MLPAQCGPGFIVRDSSTRGRNTLRVFIRACIGTALLASAGLTSACRQPVYTVEADGPVGSQFHQFRVLRNGQPIAMFDPYVPSQFHVPGEHFVSVSTTLNSLSVERLTPCGWGAVSFKSDRHAEDHSIYYLDVIESPGEWDEIHVFVDNRRGGPATVAVGELEEPVGAGQYTDIDFGVSNACPQADQLKLNGHVIASISQVERERKDHDSLAQIMIDTTADHCYTYEWATYGIALPGDEHIEGKESLPAKRVRLFEQSIDFEFLPLPQKIASYSRFAHERQGALNDRPCGH